MKKLTLYLLAAIMTIAVGCEKFDDSAIWDKLNSFESRLVALEQLCSQINTNISSLQSVVTALQNNDYVTNIAPISEDGKIIGYTITFSKSDPITIYNGKDGTNGIDGATPKIGVKKANDNIYYWTLNGEWLFDDDGNKIKAEGATNKDGITPKLKIEKEYWYVSYDNGSTWTKLGKATSDSSDKDEIITNVTYDDEYVYITLADGTKLAVPRNNENINNNEANVPKNQIWYTSTDSEIITPNLPDGINIISNIYKDGMGIITFDNDITNIPNEAFRDRRKLLSIILPETVTSIGDYAFRDCRSLMKINIPQNVKSIGTYALSVRNNILNSIILPDGITSIGEYAFSHCNALATINIPQSLTTIQYGTFNACFAIEEITIPENIKLIEDCAFIACKNLKSVYFKSKTPPTILGTDVFKGSHSSMKIYVPSVSVNEYKNAANWSSYASIIVEATNP